MRKNLSKKWHTLLEVEREGFIVKSKESSKEYSLKKGVIKKVKLFLIKK